MHLTPPQPVTEGSRAAASKRAGKTVLMFTPHPALGGGVINIAETVQRHLADFEPERFIVGRRPGLLGKVLRGVTPVYDTLRLALRLSMRRHDVYHINPSLDRRSVLRDGVFLLVLRAFRRRNVLVFFHGWDQGLFQAIASTSVRRFLFRYAYGHAARTLVLASSFADALERLGYDPERIRVTTAMFDGALMRRASRRRSDSAVRILFLARFVAEKGIHELLRAFEDISRDEANTVLVMAGDGPELGAARDWCAREQLSDRVSFPGYVDGLRKAQLLADADIFVLPSYGEGCPVALLEAMSAGLPVVVTPVGGIPDIIEDAVNGLVVAAHDPEPLAAALRRLLRDRGLRTSMGRHNAERAWCNYEAQEVTASIEAHYREIIGNGLQRAA